jgi:hypothetical protein
VAAYVWISLIDHAAVGSHPGPIHSPSPTCYTKHEINNSGQDKAQSPLPASGAYDIELAIALH